MDHGGTGGTSTIDGNIKKHSNITEVHDSMIKVKNRTLEASFDVFHAPDITNQLEMEKLTANKNFNEAMH